MRDAIEIEQISVGTESRGRATVVVGFTVAFEYRNATIASRVTNELVQSILSQNLEARLSRASETSVFIKQQLADLEKRLLATEDKLAAFKRNNEGALPETLESRRLQLEQINTKLSELDQRIRQTQNPDDALASLDGSQVDQLKFKLKTQKINLEAYEKRRSDVESLVAKGYFPRNQLIELDRQLEVTKVEIASVESQIASLGGTSDGADNLASLEAVRQQVQAQADSLSESIKKTPVIQFELNGLMRAYENLQSEYQQTQAKLEDASTGERLEQDRQAERFEVIEQASAPTEPTKPDRPKIILAGSFGGIGFGVALVVLLEMLDKSIRNAADLERYINLKPIAVIPFVRTVADRRRHFWRSLILSILIVGLVVAAVAAVHVFYLPLDLLAGRLWQGINYYLPLEPLADRLWQAVNKLIPVNT